jgi:hypothetical protein
MRELPILFSAPMVRAILEGRKTVTRRAVKPQPREGTTHYAPNWRRDFIDGHFMPMAGAYLNGGGSGESWCDGAIRCPYGQVGDVLWVKEAHALESDVDGSEPPYADGRPILRRPADDVDGVRPLWTQPHYRATDPAPDLCCDRPGCAQCRDHDMGPHWRSPIHMPRWASRITLEVTAVRVERLQDISEAQAMAESVHEIGIPADECGPNRVGYSAWADPSGPALKVTAVEAFRELWESINGAGSWAANPWVWVVEFKRIEKEVPRGG